MAKGRVGVLEAHEAAGSSAPQTRCGRAIADYLVRQRAARSIGKRLIQMVCGTAKEAIRQAKAVRDQAKRKMEILFASKGFWDGPMGRGNVLPFSRPTDPLHHTHYEVPMANDIGMRRHGLYRRKGKLLSHIIRVSARARGPYTVAIAPTPTIASAHLAGSAG